MTQFVQLHLLTSYPPSNLNRDDLGRPKTAMMGGTTRLRISSQSLKRAWRTSDIFQQALEGHLGTRTKEMGRRVYAALVEKGVSSKKAMEWAKAIAARFGKLKTLSKKEKEAVKNLEEPERRAKLMTELDIEQLAHFSPEEMDAIDTLVDALVASGTTPTKEQLALLRERHTAADIALFGRMLASSPKFNTEASAQVAHAISVHKVAVEDDFFTAVDDLNSGEDDMGAAHMGETEFGAGLFYQYICVDRDMLEQNLSGDSALAKQALEALIRAAATVAPGGKQNSFASRARASYILCERGEQQPRSLSVAFLRSIAGDHLLHSAIEALEQTRERMDQVYGDPVEHSAQMNAASGEGSLQEIIDCALGE